jgi:hypothetical protein
MVDPAVRKAITLELFAATGESIPEDDPIVTGAILFSHKLNEVARLSSEGMHAAGQRATDAVNEAAQKASLVLHEASQRCAAESAAASVRADAAARAAALQIERLTADRAQLLKAIEAHVLKSVKLASKNQPGQDGLRHVPVKHAVVGAVVGAVALAAAWMVGVEHGSALAEEAAVGRSFVRVVPKLDPKLKSQLMEYLRNNPG